MKPVKLLSGVLVAMGVSAGSASAKGNCDPHTTDDRCLDLLPIALKCPAENHGVLELIALSRSGVFDRTRIRYEAGIATELVEGFGESLSPDMGDKKIDLRTKLDPADRILADAAIPGAEKLMRDVCLASEEARQKYEATLKANRAELGLKP